MNDELSFPADCIANYKMEPCGLKVNFFLTKKQREKLELFAIKHGMAFSDVFSYSRTLGIRQYNKELEKDMWMLRISEYPTFS